MEQCSAVRCGAGPRARPSWFRACSSCVCMHLNHQAGEHTSPGGACHHSAGSCWDAWPAWAHSLSLPKDSVLAYLCVLQARTLWERHLCERWRPYGRTGLPERSRYNGTRHSPQPATTRPEQPWCAPRHWARPGVRLPGHGITYFFLETTTHSYYSVTANICCEQV